MTPLSSLEDNDDMEAPPVQNDDLHALKSFRMSPRKPVINISNELLLPIPSGLRDFPLSPMLRDSPKLL